MKRLEFIMGMPIIVRVEDTNREDKIFEEIFDYFRRTDARFSPYKADSDVTRMNDGRKGRISKEMRLILELCQQTKNETDGYFDVWHAGTFDPSGLVKGWAINEASKMLEDMKYKDFYVEASGDIQTHGLTSDKQKWAVGIKNPFKKNEIVKVVYLSGEGVATSGTYEKGNHIYNPHQEPSSHVIVSLTVIGPNVYEADRFATACFAMGKEGINFLERQKGEVTGLSSLEGYMIDRDGIATMTSGFEKYIHA